MKEQTKLTTLAILFGVLVSVCYSMGFWQTFNINVFQYAALTDVLKAAILPLSFVLLGVGLAFVFMEGPRIVGPSIPVSPPSPITNRIILTLIRWKELFVIIWFGGASLTYQMVHEPWKWFVLVVAASPAGALIADAEFLSNVIPHTKLRRGVAFIAMPFPFLALFSGSLDAHKIMDNQANYVIEAKSLDLQKVTGTTDKLEYVGFVGNTFFLYDPFSRGLLLLKQSDNLVLNLLPNPARK